MASIYNFKEHTRGDTFKEQGLVVSINGTPVDLAGAKIRMDLKASYNAPASLSLNETSGITIDLGTAGRFVIDEQIIDIDAGNYLYDIEITNSAGQVFTYVKGTFPILQDVTNG
jgi:hypothetical protein